MACSVITCLYSVILSVLDPRKCEYLKDYSLDFEHAYMTTYPVSWEACRCLFTALWHPDAIGTTTSAWRHVAHNRVVVLCYLKIFNEFVDQLDDDELRNGYFQQDGATCHTSNENMTEIEGFFDDRIISKALWPSKSPDLSPPDFFLWGALKEKLMPTSHAPYRKWKTTLDVKLLRLVRTSCRPLSQTWRFIESADVQWIHFHAPWLHHWDNSVFLQMLQSEMQDTLQVVRNIARISKTFSLLTFNLC